MHVLTFFQNQTKNLLHLRQAHYPQHSRCIIQQMSICVCYCLSISHPQHIDKCMRKVGVSGITVDLTRETNSQRETTQSTIISYDFSGWGDGCDFVFHTRKWNIDTGQFPHAWAVPGSPGCRSAILLLCEKGELLYNFFFWWWVESFVLHKREVFPVTCLWRIY